MNATRFILTFATAAGIAAVAAVDAAPAAAQDTWSWNSALASGRTIEIKGINGAISAVAASGGDARVVARKTARRSNTDDVRIEVIEHAGGVTICAVYPSRSGREPNECRPGDGGRMNVQNNDVRVEFEVQVPRGVHFVGRTVNGNIEANGIAADAIGRTVNGSITMDAAGMAQASTVNGRINVTMGRTAGTEPLEFQTVNGGITVTFLGDVNADVSASTVNGSIDTDFPLQVVGRFGPKRVNGTIGTGGRRLELSTVNGSIELRRR